MPAGTEDEEKEKGRELKFCIDSKNLRNIHAALKVAASLPGISYREKWDENPFLFHVNNGVIDLLTGKPRKALPEDNLLKISPAEYSEDAKCDGWRTFLNQVFSSDIEMIDYFQRCVGYSMTGNVSEQVLFACHGNGANGKSTALGVISYIMGDYATDLATSSLEKFGKVIIGDGVDLIGARFAKCEETSDSLDANRLKSWTGENAMRVRPLRKEWITFESHAQALDDVQCFSAH